MIVGRLRRRLAEERGVTIVELLITMAILGIVISGLTTVFVSGSHAELDMNRRYQAQEQARLALDRIRTDIHCASAAQAQTIGTYPGLKLAINNQIGIGNCSTAPVVSWCVVTVTTTPVRYALYRSTATSNICVAGSDATRVLVADYLINTNAFSTAATIAQNALQTVGVDFRINVNPAVPQNTYELSDSIVARNASRCVISSCTAPTVS
jgi:prepilin-type N-terminal cleavage/methylation domain-containing protein